MGCISNTRYSAKKKAANTSGYDFSKSFAQQIDDWIAGKIPKNDSLLVGKTPEVFQKIGFNALPMTINQTHVDYAINGTKNTDHTIGADGLKQLPQALEHPIAVIASKTQNGTSVVALLPFTHNGNTVIAPVVVDGYARQNNVLIDSNAVTSVHGRKNAVTRLLADALNDYANGETSLFYWDKEKATTLLRKARVTMPKSSAQARNGYISSIRDENSPVKPKLNDVTESVQFKRWFGDWQKHTRDVSKIVNDDGTPKVMYHQTDGDFTAFQTKSTGAGQGDAGLPNGAFFKSSDADIGVKGNKQMAVYLNVRNPLRLQDRTAAQSYWEKHVDGYKELMQESKRLNSIYNMRLEQAEEIEDKRYTELWQQLRDGKISEEEYQKEIEEDVSQSIQDEWEEKDREITRKAKDLLDKYMQESKYDGIILASDQGSFGRSTDSVIVFSSNQIKSATDNIGTFDRFNSDIRYSTKTERSGRTVSGEDAFKEDKYYQRQLDQWEELRDGTRIKVGVVQENSALNKVGIPAERVFYDISKIRKTMDKHGNQLSIRELKQIPALLGDPIVITEYEGAPNTVNVYGNLFTAKGAPIVVGMVVHTDIDGSTLISNIRTVHPRSNYAKQITDASVLYLNEDKKRTRTWFHVCDNLKVPLDGTKFGFIRSITYQNAKVNRYSVNSTREQLDAASQKYGAIEPGENPARAVTMPQRVDSQTRVRRFYRTAAEASQTSDRMVSELEKEVLNNAAASYEPVSNARAMDSARSVIEHADDGGNAAWSGVVNGGKAPSPADVALGEQLLDRALRSGDDARAVQLVEELSVIGTRAGQAVQAMRILKKLGGTAQLRYVKSAVDDIQRTLDNRYGTRATKLEIPQDLQARLMRAQTEAEKEAVCEEICQNIADQLPVTWEQKWNAWRYFSMLANPRTHFRNMVGNVAFVPAVHLKNVTAAMIEAGAARVYHARTGETMERTKTLRASVPSAARKAARATATAEYKLQKEIVQGGGKYNTADQIRDKQKIFKNRLLNYLMDKNDKALETEDGWFLHYHYVNAMANYLLSNNLTEQDLYNADGSETRYLARARNIALQEAQRNTYRDASRAATALNRLSRQNKGLEIFVEGLVPFKKTPVNILKRGWEYSPGGIITATVQAAKDLRAGRINASQYIDRLAAGLSGSGIAVIGMFFASIGCLRAGSSGDDDKDKYEEYALGYQDFSLQIGNNSYTIDWAAPTVMPLMVGVQVYNALTKDGYSTSDILDSFSLIAEPLLSLSMLDGLQSTLSSVSSEDSNQLANLVFNVASSYVAQGIPTLAGQIARIQQGGSKTVYTDPDIWLSTRVQKIIYKARNKIPAIPQAIVGNNKWLQWYNDHCTIAAGQDWVDTWGRVDQSDNVLYNIISNMVSPGYYSKIQVGKTDEEILRLYKEFGDTSVLPTLPQKRLTIKDADGISQTVILNSDQYTQIKKDYGTMAYKLLGNLVNDDNYKSASDEDKLEMVDKIYEYAMAVCKNNIDSRHALTSTQQKIKDSGINPARAIAVKNRIDAFEDDDSLTQKEIKQKQREYISNLSGFSAEQKKSLDKIAVSPGTFIPDDTDIDYSNAETFRISGMSESAQEKWQTAKADGWDAERYKTLYKIAHGKGKKVDKLAEAKDAGFSQSEFNYIWKLAYDRKK